MTEQAICEGNYSESFAQHTTGGSVQVLDRVRLAVGRVILGELWEGSR